MRHKGGPRLLLTDRESALYLERARVFVDGNRVVYYIADDEHAREFNIPFTNLAVLFLGQGTSITQEAIRLLGEEKVHLAVTGSGGSPLHMGALTTYSGTDAFRKMLRVYSEDSLSLLAAKEVMRLRSERIRSIGAKLARKYLKLNNFDKAAAACSRLEENLQKAENIPSILGYEGTFTKALYRAFAEDSGLSNAKEFRRTAGSDESDASKIGLINSLIDHGNYLCYGISGAALWALGIPPHLSVFHGKTRAGGLVFDIADAFKDAFVLPIAFSFAKSKIDGDEAKKEFRGKMINAFDDRGALSLAFETVAVTFDVREVGDACAR